MQVIINLATIPNQFDGRSGVTWSYCDDMHCVLLHACRCEVKVVQEHGVARLWELQGSISYLLATRSSQMNAEVSIDVDPKY